MNDAYTQKTGIKNKIIAVCGKGGVGKTAFTAILAKLLTESGEAGRLLLIDADPAQGLTNALGVKAEKTIGQVREALIDTARNGGSEEIAEMAGMLDFMIMESLIEKESYALIAMGRSESQGCFCSVNDLLRDSIRLLSEQFDTILIDGEAGLEQINRQVVGSLDCLILLTDGSSRGMQTVKALKDMVEKSHVVNCGKLGVVFNRVSTDRNFLKESAESIGIEVFGFVGQDTDVRDYDIKGKALTELPSDNFALTGIHMILDKIMK